MHSGHDCRQVERCVCRPLFKPCGSDALRRKGGGVGGGNVGLGSPVVVIHIVGYDCKIQISQSSSHVDVNTEPFVWTVVFKHAVAVVVVEAHGSDSRRLGGEQSVVDRQPVRRRCRVFIVHACQVVAVGIEAELMVCRGIGGKSIEWLQSHFAPRSVGDGKLAAHVAGTQTGCPLFAGREVHIFSGCGLCAHHDVVRQIFSRIGKRNRHKSLSHTAFYVDRGFFILFHAVWLLGKKCRGDESLLVLVAVAGGKDIFTHRQFLRSALEFGKRSPRFHRRRAAIHGRESQSVGRRGVDVDASRSRHRSDGGVDRQQKPHVAVSGRQWVWVVAACRKQ